jgi:hypothetical protein
VTSLSIPVERFVKFASCGFEEVSQWFHGRSVLRRLGGFRSMG